MTFEQINKLPSTMVNVDLSSNELKLLKCLKERPLSPHEASLKSGLGEKEAAEQGIKIDTFCQELAQVDRAILEGKDQGFVKIHVKKGTDKILGATIVATNAGDMIAEITLAMTYGLGLAKIADTIHPYPTQAEAIRKVGDQYKKSLLTPRIRVILDTVRWFAGMH